jgi:hypothetical protein
MPLRFYRRVSLIPGLRLNASRGGLSLSIGHRGAWRTIGPRGQRVSVGLPGTGLFWTEHIPSAQQHQIIEPISAGRSNGPPLHVGYRLAFVVGLVVLAAAIIMLTKLT